MFIKSQNFAVLSFFDYVVQNAEQYTVNGKQLTDFYFL
jgi:hypothetical protein